MEEYYWWKWNSGEVPENICKQLIEIGNDKWESSIIQIPKENKKFIKLKFLTGLVAVITALEIIE